MEVTRTRPLDDLHAIGSTAQGETRRVRQLLAAAVKGNEEIVRATLDSQFNDRVFGNNNRTHVERVRCNGGQRKDMGARNNDRATDRKGIGGGTRRRRHYQTVGLVDSQRLAVDGGVNGNHRGVVALQNGYVIQRTTVTRQGKAIGIDLDDCTGVHSIVFLVKCSNGALYLLGIDVGQKTQSPGIDAEDGNLFGTDHAGCTEKGAIASHRDGKIGLKLAVVEDMNTTERQLLSFSNKGIEVALDKDFGLVL